MTKLDYTDKNGLRRRVLVKSEYDNPEKGIPIDVYDVLDEYLEDASTTFRHKLYTRLWDMGLIEANDFLAATAKQRVRQALNSSLARDAVDITRHILNITEK